MVKLEIKYLIPVFICIAANFVVAMPVFFPKREHQAETQSSINERLKPAIRLKVESDQWFQQHEVPDTVKSFIRRAYKANNYHSVWVIKGSLRESANDLVMAIKELETHGINSSEFRSPGIVTQTAWVFPINLKQWSEKNADLVADLELILSCDFFKTYTFMRYGRLDPRKVDPEWYLIRSTQTINLQVEEWIDLVIKGDIRQFIANQAPPFKQYSKLREVLAHYKQNLTKDPLIEFPKTLKLKRGNRNAKYVPLLRLKLQATRDLPSDVTIEGTSLTPLNGKSLLPLKSQETFDEPLDLALRKFQARHGLKVTGQLNSLTIADLNVSLQERIYQMKANLERWRWMPRKMPPKFIVVNIAEYKLYLWDSGQLAVSMNVVVGQEFRKTPSFQSEIRIIETNPKWYVPRSIAEKDLLPKLKRGPASLVKQGFHIFSKSVEVNPSQINWKSLDRDSFDFSMVQDAGPSNALGRIKFWLPNSFGIYLHDTPSKELFDKPIRNFSSGCIRLEMPVTLAKILLQGDPVWTPERLETEIESGNNTKIELKKPMPIFIDYWTTSISDDLTVSFRPDVYSRNIKIISLL